MNSTIETVRPRHAGGDPKEVPRWSMPMIIDISKCPRLGEHAGPALVRLARACGSRSRRSASRSA